MCFKIGIPLAAQSVMISLSCVILQSMVNRFDEEVVSAFTVTSKVELLLDQPFIALRIMGVMYWPLGMIFIIRGLLNGAGDSGYAMTKGIWKTTMYVKKD